MTKGEHLGMGRRVLIVDDHPGFRRAARALLEAEGFEIAGEADDGEGAVSAALTMSPDIVLLDIQLPGGIDGFEVARRIAQGHEPPVVILVSSRAASDYGRLLEGVPVRAFIGKAELSAARIVAALGERA